MIVCKSHIATKALKNSYLPASFLRSRYHTPGSFPSKWNSKTPFTLFTSSSLQRLFIVSKSPSTPPPGLPWGALSVLFLCAPIISWAAEESSTSKKKSGKSLLPVDATHTARVNHVIRRDALRDNAERASNLRSAVLFFSRGIGVKPCLLYGPKKKFMVSNLANDEPTHFARDDCNKMLLLVLRIWCYIVRLHP